MSGAASPAVRSGFQPCSAAKTLKQAEVPLLSRRCLGWISLWCLRGRTFGAKMRSLSHFQSSGRAQQHLQLHLGRCAKRSCEYCLISTSVLITRVPHGSAQQQGKVMMPIELGVSTNNAWTTASSYGRGVWTSASFHLPALGCSARDHWTHPSI